MDNSRTTWGGVYPAPICPMNEDQSIDHPTLERYAAWLASHPGVSGLVVNGNAGEVTLLSDAEALDVVRTVRAAVPRSVKVVTGIVADSTVEAIRQIKASAEAGADAAMVFPIKDWMTSREPGSAEAYFARIAEHTDLPIFIFQYPWNRGSASYPIDVLVELVQHPNVVAIKEAIWEVARYQQETIRLREVRPDLTILSGNDEHILGTLAIGADGLLLGYASLIPDRIVAMFEAMRRGDLLAARQIDAELQPLTRCIYQTQPFARRHSRIKVALNLMGILPSAMVREPLLPLDDEERALVSAALRQVGLYAGSRSAAELQTASV